MNRYFVKPTLWLIALALLATGCSDDSGMETPSPDVPGKNTLTFKVEAPGTNAPDTRAHWDYSETYTEGAKLGFNWDTEEDNLIGWIRYNADGEDGKFSYTYYTDNAGTLTHKDGEVYASIDYLTVGDETGDETVDEFDAAADRLHLFFPPCYITRTWDYEGNEVAYAEMSINGTSQIGESTSHLKESMYMYGEYKSEDEAVKLKHITAVLRFIVTNKRGEPVNLHSVTMESENEKFNTQVYAKCTSTNQDIVIEPQTYNASSSITTYITDMKEKSVTYDGYWDEDLQEWINEEIEVLEPVETGFRPLAADDKVAVYQAVMPTITADMDIVFKVQCVSSIDEEGFLIKNDNDEPVESTTYTSLVLSGDRIQTILEEYNKAGFCSGYYYTFNLLLDDKLTLTGMTVSPWEGIDDYTGDIHE